MAAPYRDQIGVLIPDWLRPQIDAYMHRMGITSQAEALRTLAVLGLQQPLLPITVAGYHQGVQAGVDAMQRLASDYVRVHNTLLDELRRRAMADCIATPPPLD